MFFGSVGLREYAAWCLLLGITGMVRIALLCLGQQSYRQDVVSIWIREVHVND